MAIGDAGARFLLGYDGTAVLAPSTTYTLQIRFKVDKLLELPYQWTISINGSDFLVGFPIPAVDTWYAVSIPFTTAPSGDLSLRLGLGDAEFPSNFYIGSFYGLRIFTHDGNPSGNPPDVFASGTSYYYTSADTNIVFQGNTYVPALFTRSAITFPSNDSDQTTFDLAMPRDHPIAQLYATSPPAAPLGLTVLLVQRPDLTEARVAFDGQATHNTQSLETFTIRFQRTVAFLKIVAPRWLLGAACPYSNGDTFCAVVRTDFAMSAAVVSAISGNTVTVTGLNTFAVAHDLVNPTSYFVAGELVTADGARWAITGQQGDVVSLLLPPSLAAVPNLAVSDTVTLFAGDDNLEQTCVSRFLNGARFGGHINLRERSMFEGAGLSGV
jgi:hypothetical protein